MSTPVSVIKTDPVWFKNIGILFKIDRLTEFFPYRLQTLEERMNSVVRLGVYVALLLAIYNREYRLLLIAPAVMLFTYFIYKRHKVYNKPADTKSLKSILKTSKAFEREPEEVKPTLNNPFMNPTILDIKEKPNRKAAKTYFEDTKEAEELREDIKDKFEYNLYRDYDDVYESNNNDRQFYTVPNTETPTNQEKYLEFLYGGMMDGGCKTNVEDCKPYEDLRARPYIFPQPETNPTA